jgi:hypothetical protein
MQIWLRRIIALWLIAMGIALIAFKYNNQQSGYAEKDVVYLKIENYLQPEKVKAEFPDVEPVELTGPEMNNDDFPCVWWAIYDMDETWTTDTCDVAEWEKVQRTFFDENDKQNLLVFHDMLIRAEKYSGFVAFHYLGEYNPHLKDFSNEKLLKYPAIINAVNQLNSSEQTEAIVSTKDWNRFVARNLDPINDGQCFRYNEKVYGPEFGTDVIWKEGKIKALPMTLKIAGLVLLILGIWLLTTVYTKRSGIMINPQRVAMLYDGVALLFGVPAAWLLASVALEKWLYIEPFFDDEYMAFMGVFIYIFCIPFISAFTGRFTSQSLKISSKGILIDNIRNKKLIYWDEIAGFDFSDEYILVGRLGMPVPRKIQKSLKIHKTNGGAEIINEPQLKSVKDKIKKEVEKKSPESVKLNFLTILSEW